MKLSYRNMSILLVDSQDQSLESLASSIAPFSLYRLWRAKAADEAMNILRSKPVHLAIVAFKLQPVSGPQMLAMLRKVSRLQDLPVLITVDKGDQAMAEQALSAGASGLLELPLDHRDVLKMVDEALAPMVDPVEEEFLRQMQAASQAQRMGDLGGAEKAYRAALAARGDEKVAHSLGKLLSGKGDMDGAAGAFLAALRANPMSLRSFLGLAQVFQASGRLEDALKVLAGAVNAAKSLKESGQVQSSIFFYMGELQLELQRLQEALGLFSQAMEANPDSSQLSSSIGDSLVKAGFPRESEHFYLKALEVDPEPAHVYNQLAIAYRRQGKFDLAINLYGKALAFHSHDENLLYNTARCHWEKGDDQEAARLLGQALAINPLFPEAESLLAAVQRRLGSKSAQGKPANQA